MKGRLHLVNEAKQLEVWIVTAKGDDAECFMYGSLMPKPAVRDRVVGDIAGELLARLATVRTGPHEMQVSSELVKKETEMTPSTLEGSWVVSLIMDGRPPAILIRPSLWQVIHRLRYLRSDCWSSKCRFELPGRL